MAVTVDLIPLLPGESPGRAIARIYEDGVAIRWDGETEEVTLECIGDGGEPIEHAPAGAFDEWRAEVRRRLLELHPWQSETERGCLYLWSRNFQWQVEIADESDCITLRSSRGWNPDPDLPNLDDTELLVAFEGLRTILHWPHHYGSSCDLDDADDRPMLIG